MTVETSRRSFMRGAFTSDAPGLARALRPYGAVAEAAFVEACTGCGDCARACPQDMIRRDKAGLAVLDLAQAACTFCRACTEACETGALVAGTPWTWRAEVDASCLSINGVQCRACEDFCDAQAIRFRLQTGGRAQPLIETDACTGCGACVAPCPAGALTLIETNPVSGPAPGSTTGPATETLPC